MDLKFAILATAIILACVAIASAQEPAPTDAESCQMAANWHDRAAMHWTESQDQEYHLWAAFAADRIGVRGGDCSGWEVDAHRYDANFRIDAASWDEAQIDYATAKEDKVN